MYELTDSAVYLGYAGLSAAVPGILFTLFGGVMADRHELSRLLAVTQVVIAILASILGTLTALDVVQPWHILVIAFLTGTSQAFNNPARQAIFPQLVERDALPNAVSLNAMVWQGTRMIAPAIGGVGLATLGPSVTFFFCTVGFLTFAFVVTTLRVNRPPTTRTGVLEQLFQGCGYVFRSSLFLPLVGLTFFNAFFGIANVQIFPVFAKEVLDVGASGLGLMFSSVGVGALTGLLISSALSSVKKRGLIILAGSAAYGISLLLFALVTNYLLSLCVLFAMGMFSQIYANTIQTVMQLRVPDALRGRVMGIYTMTFNMGPLGAMQAGLVAATFGPSSAVLVGAGAILALGLLLALFNPTVRDLAFE